VLYQESCCLCLLWLLHCVCLLFVFAILYLCSYLSRIGLLLVFLIPRVPGVSFNGDKPLTAATGDFAYSITTAFPRAPANFTFPAFADLQLNTQGSFIPITFTHLYATVYDLDTGRQVGTGDLGHYTVPAKAYPDILLPITFSYKAPNATDPTWLNWYDACKNTKAQQTTDGTRPSKLSVYPTIHHRFIG